MKKYLIRSIVVLLVLIGVFSAFVVGARFGFDYGARGARFTAAQTSYSASVLLRNNKPAEALIYTDGDLLYILPALHETAASPIFSSLPLTENSRNLEKHILKYFSLHKPPSIQFPVDYFDGFNSDAKNKEEMKSWLRQLYANQKKAYDLIDAYKIKKAAEQDAAANP